METSTTPAPGVPSAAYDVFICETLAASDPSNTKLQRNLSIALN